MVANRNQPNFTRRIRVLLGRMMRLWLIQLKPDTLPEPCI